ncbi:DUF7547 family protein [Salinigranum halophilum]|jgi:hypothetical protein|uniref:DUF7547 family protein n=1 Tax=Salinigranum halophilum TaxID=2565931 RepID=UPI00115CD219|nr:hypothetical protein [Salinigranum halophilum]
MSHDPDRDDLATLLSDLRTTLDDLERTLDTDDGRDRRPARREPPRGSDVVRFTEEYTIPTVIAILETTIQSLELLRGVLRLADPERSLRGEGTGSLDGVDRRVVEGTERALDDLRRALTGTEEPTDPVARDVFREARDLTGEIESRLAAAREAGRESPSRSRRSGDERRSVVIPVDDETADGRNEPEADVDDAGAEHDDAAVDVDAELESIRDEVRAESAGGDEGDDESDEVGNRENGDGDGAV